MGYFAASQFYFTQEFFVGLLASAFLLAFGYSFNDYTDGDVKKKYFLLPLLLTFTILPFLSKISAVFIISMIIISFVYSWKKTRLKSYPIVCTLLNSIHFELMYLLGIFTISSSISPIGIWLGLVLFSFQTSAQLIHELTDYNEDRENKIKTTAIWLGKEKTIKLSIFFLFLGSLASLPIFLEKPLITLGSVIYTATTIPLILKRKIPTKEVRFFMRKLGIAIGILYLFSLVKA